VNKVEGGVESRIGELDVTDEIATLALDFDYMLDVLQAQHHQIQLYARDLENKVELRTQELSQQKRDLQQNIELLNQTREKLVAKEKLAAVGQLAAGVAHEINNPTAVILGNMDLLIDDLGEHAKPISTQTDLIIQQVYRIRAIINNLLQYSRPESYQEVWNDVDMNRVISDSLVLVQHDLIKHHVSYRQDCRATRKVTGNHQQYQQVIINLLINAVNAIGDKAKGSIRIRSRNWKDNAVLVTIRDNGCGISEENLKRIFDPFFTKTTGGTGLGLHVTNSILDRYGAEISVRSKLGSGTCFYLWFQCKTD
jgi:two-component system NtrC family sensor kinase